MFALSMTNPDRSTRFAICAVAAVRLLGRGRLSVFRTVFLAPLVVLGVTALATKWMFVVQGFGHFHWAPLNWLAHLTRAAAILLALAATAWWCWGVHRKVLRLLHHNRLTVAALTFAVAVAGTAWTAALFAAGAEGLHVLASKAVMPSQARARLPHPKLGQPWTVVAHPELQRILATGLVGLGSAKALEQVILANPDIRVLQLESPGGLVVEETALAALVQAHGLDTLVMRGCHSACTDVFLAGRTRYITPAARFGFHQAGYDGMPQSVEWGYTEYEAAIEYRRAGVAEPFLAQALNTPYQSMWYPHVLDLMESGFANRWWSERPRALW